MMRENSLTSWVIGVSVKILLVLIVVNIFGCKYTGMSFSEMRENGGVLICVQHTMQQKSEEAINNVFDQLMSRM